MKVSVIGSWIHGRAQKMTGKAGWDLKDPYALSKFIHALKIQGNLRKHIVHEEEISVLYTLHIYAIKFLKRDFKGRKHLR